MTVADRLDAKYALGSAVGVADGLSKAGIAGRAVALFGDSSFFHSMLPAICNAVVNRSDILMIVLDNGATVTSGFQPNPGVPRDALGRPAPALSIERIAAACGVEFIRTVTQDQPGSIPGSAISSARRSRIAAWRWSWSACPAPRPARRIDGRIAGGSALPVQSC